MEPVTFGMAGFSLMSGMGGIGLTASATATAVTTAATATTAASMVLYWGVGHLGSWGCTAKVPWPIGWRVCRTNGWSTETWQKKLSIEQQARTQCQACPFVVRYYGPVYRGKDTVLGMEILQDLCSTYSNAGLWGNEEHVKMHIACVAEALAFAHARNIWQRDIKHKTFCWTHRVIILGLRKWARLTGHGPASELLNTGPELVQGAGYNEAVDWWVRTVFKKAAFPWEGPRHCNIRPQQPKQFFRLPLQGHSEAVEVLACCKASKVGSARQESGSAWYEGFGWPHSKPDSVRSQCPTLLTKLTTTALASSPVCCQSASADSSSPTPTQSDVATATAKVKFLARVLKKTWLTRRFTSSRQPQRSEKMESFLQAMTMSPFWNQLNQIQKRFLHQHLWPLQILCFMHTPTQIHHETH